MKRRLLIVQILFLLIFAGCAGYLAKYFYDSHQAQNDIALLREQMEENAPQASLSPNATPIPPARAENGMLLKYYDLYTQNSDIVGWIKIDGTKIDYPVMQSEADNEYYIHRNFEKKYRYSGLPFLDYECDAEEPSTNLIIYAHNMKDGTMFAALTDYDEKDFYNKHKTISFDTLYEEKQYEIIGVFKTKVGGANEFKYYEYTDLYTKEEFKAYTDKVKELSLYDTGMVPVFGDYLLTLSTCSYGTSNERFVVVAREVSQYM